MASSQPASQPAGTKENDKSKEPQKTNKPLEEDDEFEDFPVEDWPDAETDGKSGKSKNLWEESWDDDDTTDDFAAQLREELRKVPSKNESMS